ncbi:MULTISPECIES: hypothetical protein [unclassified Pseudomonas]|uniref:hypothetical protein n=1 Tax=unclassified Pseudomonas TaxID=196821 RepID=UPI000CD318FB|nr:MULTISPECIES: hypothetical protein [unclassified Pseudomonas]POA30887.1 hypothetical protein C1887_14270 [Pseudomonas sp. GW456-R21]POA67915.1 hypothetical protein C1884_10975 [Pseudomonas sp. GW460-R15]
MTANEKLRSKLTRQQLAEQVRNNHRSFNSAILADPHPAPKIAGLVGDGLPPKALLDETNVVVVVESLNEYSEGDTGELQLLDPSEMVQDPTNPGGPLIPKVIYQGPVQNLPDSAAGYPQSFALPSVELVDFDKVHAATRLQVRVMVTVGSTGNLAPTDVLDIGVDRYAPYQSKQDGSYLRPVRVEVLNVPGDIDEQWLKDNTHLKLKVDVGYQFYLSSDRIHISISTTESGADGPLPNVVYSGWLTASGLVDILVKDFENEVKNDGPIYVSYVLADEVGNDSKVSLNTTVKVVLRPEPEFQKPRIPIVTEGGTLDYKTLESKVYAFVDRGNHWNPTDKILLKLRRVSDGAIFEVAELPVGTGNLLRFDLIYLVLKLLPIDDETVTRVELFYELKRGVETPRPSPPTDFIIDLTKAGPVNPDLPSLTNPNMAKVVVTGASGTPNHIKGEDRGKPATIQTSMAEAGGSWTPLGNEEAEVVYEGEVVHSEGLKGGQDVLEFNISEAVIDRHGTGKKFVWWTILGDLSSNKWLSKKTEVTVDAAIVEFDAPSAPTFPITDGGVRKQVVNCRSLTMVGTDRQLVVTVPINPTYMPAGSTVVVHSVGTSDREGFVPIPGADFSEAHTITPAEVTAGEFEVSIRPYSTKIKSIQPTQGSGQLNGAIKISYVVQIKDKSYPSDEFLREVRLLANGLYCEGTETL